MPKKKQQSLPKKPNNLKIAFLALGVLILLIIIGRLFTFLISLQKPISSEFNTEKKYTWNQTSTYNVAFIANAETDNPDISVVTWKPSEGKTVVLHLSPNIYTEVSRNYGNWRLGSVFALGQEETKPIGPALIKETLTKMLALPIDGIVMLPESTEFTNTEAIVESFRTNKIPDFLYLSKIKSDLTKWEAIKLYQSLSNVRADKVDSLNFERSTITESKLLPDASRVLGVNTVRLDLFIRDTLSDPVIIDENFTVAIFNATDTPGLGQEVSRYVTNMGASVIILQNLDQKIDKTSVVLTPNQSSPETLNSVTYQRVAQFLAPHCLENQCLLQNPKIDTSRATINIVIGQDYTK